MPPGAHIDVYLPNGLTRQYSLTNGPGDSQQFRIAVKLAPNSRGGSSAIWGIEEGEVLSIGLPRDAFPLAPDASEHILVAAGIGITPLFSMAQHLSHRGHRFHLRYFGRSYDEMPFRSEIASSSLAPHAQVCAGLPRKDILANLQTLLAAPNPHKHLYVCGPPAFMELAIATAIAKGWLPATIHSEAFAHSVSSGDSSPLTVTLARSGMRVPVKEGQTILDAVRAAGITHESSCEVGVCGACIAHVLSGEPDHRDQFLDEDEKQSGRVMLICVSRARGSELTLDL